MRGPLIAIGLAAVLLFGPTAASAQQAEAAVLARNLTGINAEILDATTGAVRTSAILSSAVDTCRLTLFWNETASEVVLDLGRIGYVDGSAADGATVVVGESSAGGRVYLFELSPGRQAETTSAFEGLARLCGATLGPPPRYEVEVMSY